MNQSIAPGGLEQYARPVAILYGVVQNEVFVRIKQVYAFHPGTFQGVIGQ